MFLYLTSGTKTNAQNTQIIDMFDYRHGENGIYFKDTQNYLNQYVGTWLYTNGATSLKITFQKKHFTMQNALGTYYSDALVGEYEYIVNGITIFNTLSNLNINHTSPFDYNLYDITRYPNYDDCFLCTIPKQRLIIKYDEPTNDNAALSGTFVMHTIIENRQTKLYVNFVNDYAMGMNWSKTNIDLPATTTQLTLPEGIYIFYKVKLNTLKKAI